jgi:cytochrome c
VKSHPTRHRSSRQAPAAALGALIGALLVGGVADAATPPKGDAAVGRKTFAARCGMCHGPEAAGTAMAPGLAGVYGAKAATGSYAKYSKALTDARLTWTAANLDAFIAAPAKKVPGTSMLMGAPNEADRANLVAYLATLKGPARAKRK